MQVLIRPVLAIERSGATGDNIDLRFSTIPGLPYAVQTGVDLENWSDLVTSEGDGEEFFFRHIDGGSDSN